MKIWLATTALLGLVVVGSTSCNPLGNKPAATEQPMTVTRGNLTLTVSGSGNLEAQSDAKLTFGTAGRIEKIYVTERTLVTKGTVLAKLETDALELAVAQAQMAVVQADVGVTQAQAAVTQAEAALKSAQLTLDKTENTYKWPALEIAIADVDSARAAVKYAQTRLDLAPAEQKAEWAAIVVQATINERVAETKLNAILGNRDTQEVEIQKLQVQAAQQSLDLARKSLELAQQSPDVARQALAQAQKRLADATITAPFAGVVADVPFKEKDSVSAVNPIVHLLDSGTMDLKVQVDEIDVVNVKPGQLAIISADALPNTKLEGTIDSIGLIPAQKSGVVVYDVTLTLNVPADSGLRAGMSATADIVTAQRNNIILIPDRAISKDSQGNTIVKIQVDGKSETRTVVTGLSDGIQTEIVSGLSEGDTIIERQTTSTSSSSGFFGK